ncbi:unnamed protein product [Porites evermanni]|uniref:Uncharacterized protein n=1 Tax=Porites evermanni TaxID=104178 RepID=A0ABN8QS11_9CNID|nr:unnamed protein product [Porites evermanni]
MNYFRLTVLLLHFYLYRLSFALFSLKDTDIFSIIVKPYGIILKDDILAKLFVDLRQCPAFSEAFKDCDLIFANETTFKPEQAPSKLCPSGSYSCFYNAVKSNQQFKGWLEEERERTYIQFVLEVLKSMCIKEDNSMSCGEKFISGLLENRTSNYKECKENSVGHNCSTDCQKDLQRFYHKLGCCVGSVSRIMDCFSINPQSGSYGVYVQESNSTCQVKRPAACSQSIRCPSYWQTAAPPTSPASSSTSSKGSLIVGICIAMVICIGAALIVANYCYRRMRKRAKIRFEDYGYSRLKMLEDDLYFDLEIEDDESKGLVDL